MFRQLTGQRQSLAWLNFVFLFTISIMPFASDLLGQYPQNPLAVGIFALNLLASLATQATLELGRCAGLTTPADQRTARAGRIRAAATSAIFIASIGLAWVNTDVAKFSWLLIALVPRVVDRGLPRPGHPGSDAG